MRLPPQDKLLHFIAGQVAFLTGYLVGGWVGGIGLLFFGGIAKEVYDAFHPATHTCDIWDAVATWSGGVWLAVVLLLYRMFPKSVIL